jgi:hypothetical protein|tara:strand:- start:448 stop:729 length:282 start_codon:yes stop_codon:yes gene_type:complete
MKKPACGLCAICFLLIGNLAFSIYSYNELKKPEQEVNIEIPVSKDLLRLEAKIDAIYEECKLRDSAIYRTLLELREQVTGQQTIDQRNKIAEL